MHSGHSTHELTCHKESGVYVLKTYHGALRERVYQSEYTALSIMRDQATDNVVGYWGSFTHGDTFNLLLDYVDGGNFLDFLTSTPPPIEPYEILEFWSSFFDLFKGLHGIHQLGREDNLRELFG